MAKVKRYRVVETAWRAKGRETISVLCDWTSEREAKKKLREETAENPNKLFSIETE